ncbi:Cytochrome P450 [Sesbania bispinosa]|nr:Cytochrome P450 [Sesbania bispinosa]
MGNLHMLGSLPHRSLQSLSKKYGPIMFLQLGQVPTIVVSSSQAAELFLKTHDVVFASRPKIQACELLLYGSKGLAFSEYGPYWRNMKKLCTLQLLTTSKIELFAPIRREELALVVKSLEKAAAVCQVVNLSDIVENLIEDIMYKMMLGRNRYDQFDLKRLVREALTMEGVFNLADYVPWLGPFDLQGFTRDCKKISKELDEILEMIITEHEQDANDIILYFAIYLKKWKDGNKPKTSQIKEMKSKKGRRLKIGSGREKKEEEWSNGDLDVERWK